MRRLWFDMTFTRTQSGAVGITRTVNRLCAELTKMAAARGAACMPVAFHSRGFRSLVAQTPAIACSVTQAKLAPAATGLWRWVGEGPVRTLVSRHFPLPLRRLAWLAYNWWDFNRLADDLIAADFAPGDVLFLSDASWNYPVWAAARQAQRRGALVVTVVYDLIPLRQPQFCPQLTTIAFRKWLTQLMPCTDGVLCISKSVEDDLRRFASESRVGLPPTTHFRLGCDPVASSTEVGQARPELREFVTRAPCFTAIGSIEPRKNYDLLLDVFEQLWAQDVDASLLIVGRRSPQCDELVRRIQAHPERGRRFEVLFDATDDEVAFAYGASRALVFPSLAEGFGLPLVEARAHGCQVIASNLPVFAELADEGVRLFDATAPADLRALLMSALQDERQPGLTAPFTWADSAALCMDFIESVHMKMRPFDQVGADK